MESFPLAQLQIIGIEEVPAGPPSMPRFLSAIFAVQDSDKVLFPPYTLAETAVIDPEFSNRREFDEFVANGEVSPYGPVTAESGHDLWIDDEGVIHYDIIGQAEEKLQSISKLHCEAAKRELLSGSLEKARDHAMVAYSANPESVGALALRAAAEYRMIATGTGSADAEDELALTEELAEAFLEPHEFKKLYVDLVSIEAPAASDLLVRAMITGLKGLNPHDFVGYSGSVRELFKHEADKLEAARQAMIACGNILAAKGESPDVAYRLLSGIKAIPERKILGSEFELEEIDDSASDHTMSVANKGDAANYLHTMIASLKREATKQKATERQSHRKGATGPSKYVDIAQIKPQVLAYAQ
jgi:hypothetical protein